MLQSWLQKVIGVQKIRQEEKNGGKSTRFSLKDMGDISQ